jgi:hypothetical protein
MLPDTSCLDCRDGFDRDQAALELLDAEERERYQARGYVVGDEVPQPQVIHLNGLVVEQAVMEFINLFASFKPFHPYLIYDALVPGFLAIDVKPDADCLHCSHKESGDAHTTPSNSVSDPAHHPGSLGFPVIPHQCERNPSQPEYESQNGQPSRGGWRLWQIPFRKKGT